MKAMLKRITAETWYFDDDGTRREGAPSGVSGDLSNVSGDLSNVYGNLSNVYGNIDYCDLSADERKVGVKVSDLIAD